MEINISTIKRIKNLISYLEQNKDRLVIDGDTHPSLIENMDEKLLNKYRQSDNYYHGRPISTEDLLAEMKMAKVDMCLIWQNPATIIYTDNKEYNFQKLLNANKHILKSTELHPTSFIPAGWTDPKALGLENALKLVDILMFDFGFCIVKMNPAQNAFPINSEMVITVVDRIIKNGGIPAFHYGADTPYTPPEGLEKIASLYPDNKIIAVHMGGGGAGYVEMEDHAQKTRDLGLKYPNLFFPISAKRDTHIESDIITYQLAGSPFNNNLACASDAPYGRQTWNFGGYQLMFESLLNAEVHTDPRVRQQPEQFNSEMVQNLLGRNLAELVITGYKGFLEMHQI